MITERIRGRALQRIRARHLRLHPLCVTCQQRTPPVVRAATQVDHKVPLYKGGEESEDNRQGLCDDCHRDKTATDMGTHVRGCDTDGQPLDPRHHWNS
jgi:5-methylcytosine-specific restriction enzyme A